MNNIRYRGTGDWGKKLQNRLHGGLLLELTAVFCLIAAGIVLFNTFNESGTSSVTQDRVTAKMNAAASIAAEIEPAAGDEVEDPLAWEAKPAAVPQPPAETPAPSVAATPAPAAQPELPQQPAAEKKDAMPPPPDADGMQKIEDRLGALEKSIADMNKSLATKDDIEALKSGMAAQAPVTAAPAPAAQTEAHQETAPVVAKPAHPKAVAKKKPMPAPQWILKSAKPGEAWVAKKGAENELRTVIIGDTLPGLGKITAIGRDSMGQWVVSGTKGRINQ